MKSILQVYTLFIILLFANSTLVKAQVATSSPYSRYGIGELNEKGFGNTTAMGGSHVALQNDSLPIFFINNGNPASYTSNSLTTIDLSFKYRNTVLENTANKETIKTGTIGNVALAFPIKKWWGASIGMQRLSSVGYLLKDQQEIEINGVMETVDFQYRGSGGLNKIYFGNAFKPFNGLSKRFLNSKKHDSLATSNDTSAIAKKIKQKQAWEGLSIGANISYLVGSITHIKRSIFPDNLLHFNTSTGSTVRASDIYLDYGVQYEYTIRSIKGKPLKKKVQLLAGANFSNQTNINVTTDTLSYSYFVNSLGFEVVKDTITDTENTKGEMTLPLTFGFGLGARIGSQWLVMGDFTITNWSDFKLLNQTQNLKNSLRIAAGTQYVPNAGANGKGDYFKRVNYRLGIRYAQTMVELQNIQISEQAISIGFGLPVGRSFILRNFSMMNISLEYGERGTTDSGLFKESFFNATLGFTINERWFRQQKYD